MGRTQYAEPVSSLFRLGEPNAEEWIEYQQLGLAREHFGELVGMATDEGSYSFQEGTDESWAPIHAWRALAQLAGAEAAAPLLRVLKSGVAADYGYFALPEILARIGPDVLPELARFVASPDSPGRAVVSAMRTFGLVASEFPDARGACVNELTKLLSTEDDADPFFNAIVIESLIEIGAAESLPAIEVCFDRDLVDLDIVDREQTRARLGAPAGAR